MNQPTEKLLFKSRLGISGYLLYLALPTLLGIAGIMFNQELSTKGWALIVIFIGLYSLAISTTKKIDVYESGLKLEYIFRGTTIFCPFSDITRYKVIAPKILFRERKQLVLTINEKDIHISSLLYTNVNMIEKVLDCML